jgi:MFS transporter
VIFAAFRVKSFRFQWPADLLTSWAFEMETLTLGWYVMTQTGSVLMLTVFGSLQFLGTLAAPGFGVLADRLGAGAMLRAMRASYAALAAVLMALALAEVVTPAWVLVLATVGGLVRPNDIVMRNTLIGETIPAAHLMGALALSRATQDSARIGGALAGAGLSAALGLGLTYAVVSGVYVASLALTLGVSSRAPLPDPAGPPRATLPPASGWRDLVDGVAYVLRTPALLAMMLLAFAINLTAYPISGGLLPYAAERVYHVDARGLGLLAASFALGALAGSLTMVLTRGPRHPARATLVHTTLWYALLLAFAHVERMGVGMATLLVAGFVQSVAMISMSATLLADAAPGFRARVMGVRMLAVYGLPLGLLAAGLLIPRVGYRTTLTVYTTLGLAVTVLIGLGWRAALWRALTDPLSSGSRPSARRAVAVRPPPSTPDRT